MSFNIANNNDTGSLHVGITAGSHQWNIGDKIRIQGEDKVREVTYVMGKGEKTHLCFKGQGPIKMGAITYDLAMEKPVKEQVKKAV